LTSLLQVGGRYTEEDKTASIGLIGDPNAVSNCATTAVGAGSVLPGIENVDTPVSLSDCQSALNDRADFSNFTPKVGLNWNLSDDVLAFASFTRGFRSGGYNVRFTDLSFATPTPNSVRVFGQKTADDFGISREVMDDFALESLKRAQAATKQGLFANEIAAIDIGKQSNTTRVDVDEQLLTAKPEKIRKLQPAFKENGSVTAANSSSISDGAASMIVADEQALSTYNLEPQARIVGHSSHAQSPAEFTLALIGAINKLLTQVGWTVADVDLFEINEAFAVVTLQAMRALSLDHDKVNIHGGACALGHPLGASGARIIVTLINALIATGGKRGVASLCIGGGEATAIAIEIT